ncbi:hypothetical protein GMO_22860 [Gluconobacter morbifer G707]|uniref:Uncharacterized protein n=1 Tax=Gluconobacter morbifer G707 TaxID=1088869 RepID=G6XLN7_9PROT|nr:hypothetical protein GMO_22860 [Gluconobacter morbifer G707]
MRMGDVAREAGTVSDMRNSSNLYLAVGEALVSRYRLT